MQLSHQPPRLLVAGPDGVEVTDPRDTWHRSRCAAVSRRPSGLLLAWGHHPVAWQGGGVTITRSA